MFRGDYPVTMDAKGRVAMPTRYRERIKDLCDGQMVTTKSIDGPRCVVLFPSPEWERIESGLKGLPAAELNGQRLTRLTVGSACDCDMDSHGRLLISQELRQYAGLDKRARLIGMIHKFELWDEPTWIAHREELHNDAPDLLTQPSSALGAIVF